MLRTAYLAELAAADAASIEGRAEIAFHPLAASSGAWREVLGQLSRIVAAAVFSRIWVPTGNTGRANVGALKPMPIPDDLRSILEKG